MTSGRFITFEGGEGSGKSTQVKKLANRLSSLGLNVLVTREPGGSALGERLRSLLLDPKLQNLSALTDTLLFCAARVDHLDKIIRPALLNGHIVICDRFFDSTRVYQGYAGEFDLKKLNILEEIVVGPNVPDLTIIMDLPAEMGLDRVQLRIRKNNKVLSQIEDLKDKQDVDRYEARGLEYHEKLRQGFLKIAQLEPRRCVVVNGQDTVDNVSNVIWKTIEERILKSYS